MRPSTKTTTLRAVALTAMLVASSCGSSNHGEAGAESNENESPADAVFDSSVIHTITLDFDQDDYDTMVATYLESTEKDWIEASVTIDGTTYHQVGIRLKGNSSLRRLADAEGVGFDEPSGVPWLIRLDKFIDGQAHKGINDFVVRSNGSETALNEAVALDLLEAAGLATQDAIATRFSVNGSDETLRLVMENPEDIWLEKNFDSSDALYKAESTGDYSYRGDDEDLYDEVFDQEAGKDNTDLSPLIEFLDFINNSDDDTFDGQLEERLNIDSFATYLAMQEIVDNFDDIDGPGNNSYLHWDSETGRFTVVPWDYNESFGYQGGSQTDDTDDANAAGDRKGGERPDNVEREGGIEDAPPRQNAGNQNGGGRGGSNILVERFNSNEQFASLYQEKLAELEAELIGSGSAEEFLDQWVSLLGSEANDLVSSDQLDIEAESIRKYFPEAP